MSLKRWIWLATLLVLVMGAPIAWAQPNVNVTKTRLSASTYNSGESITYRIRVRNQAAVAVNDIRLEDVFSTRFAAFFYNVESATGTVTFNAGFDGAGSGADANGDAVEDSPGSLVEEFDMAAGSTIFFVINAVTRVSANVTIANTATITLPGGSSGTTTSTVNTNWSGVSSGDLGGTLCAVQPLGAPTVSASNTVLNTYITPRLSSSVTIAAGSECLPTTGNNVDLRGALTDFSDFAIGDKLLVMQMQDGGSAITSMTDTDDASYGDLSTSTAGRYEYVRIRGALGTNGCAATELPISGASSTGGLINSYVHDPERANRRAVQYVRVAQYASLTLSGSGSVVTYPWDGLRGGVLALDVEGVLNLGSGPDTKLNASCAGFRGGGINPGEATELGNTLFRIGVGNQGLGTKGEGLAGTPRFVNESTTSGSGSWIDLGASWAGYNEGDSAKGAPYSAGGGGNACDSINSPRPESGGGAGGGNGQNGGTGGNCINNATGGQLSQSGGVGGRQIASFSFNGSTIGTPFSAAGAIGRFMMGGGGGSGAAGPDATVPEGSGGRGGGIIFVTAGEISGTGGIDANGCAGVANDLDGGGGGGGAGGSVLVVANLSGPTTLAGVTVNVIGGQGGNAGALTTIDQSRGPGGGGAGGRALFSQLVNGNTATVQTDGGNSGTTFGGSQFTANNGNRVDPVYSLNAYNSVPGVKPSFICATGTVPVTLSFIDAKVQGNELVVNFETASEAGTLGYRVYTDVPGATRMQLNAELVPGKGDSLAPQRYSVRGAFRGAREVWIEEVDVKGKATIYGPFPVGSPSGEQNIAVSTDWRSIQAEQDAFRTAEAQAIVARRSSTGALVELRTSRRGWYSVGFEQLAALGVDWNGVETRRLELRRGTRSIPVEASGPVWQAGASLRFYGEQVDGSLYTDTAVYQLRVASGDAETMRPVYANAGNLSTTASYLHTLVHAPNRAYGFSSPTDPWYAARILRNANNPGVASETVTVADRVAGTTARLTVDFWGGTDFTETPDHAVRVLVNGTAVGEARFDGFATHTLTVDLPANVLVNGSNTVGFQLLADTGAPADIVYLERIAIDYVRELKLEANGSVAFGAAQGAPGVTDGDRIFAGNFSAEGTPACSAMTPGCAAYAVQVGSNTNARAFRIRGGVAQPLTAAVNGGVLRFAALAQPGDQFRVDAAPAAPALRVAEPVGDLFGGLSAVDYLVISHPSFSAGLQPLLVARQAEGLRTHVVNVEDLYRAYTGGEFGPAAVEAFLRESHQRWPMLRYVLFVGGDTYDYKNFSGLNSIGFVPTHYRATSEFVRYAPTDTVYADVNGDGVKELAIGRFPVRTAAELANVVAKTLAYPTAGHANQLLWVTDRESNSYNYRNISGNFTAGFTNWTKQFVDLNTYPTSGGAASARGDLVSALNGGKALLGYYGHSSPSSWTREGLLTATLVNGGLFNNATRPTALFQLGCWGAYFVDPQYSSLSHAFLLRPSGAAAVIAATALTEVSSDELFSSVALPALRSGSRIGDVIRDSANVIRLSPAGQGALDVIIGTTVLGDPAMKINVQQSN